MKLVGNAQNIIGLNESRKSEDKEVSKQADTTLKIGFLCASNVLQFID